MHNLMVCYRVATPKLSKIKREPNKFLVDTNFCNFDQKNFNLPQNNGNSPSKCNILPFLYLEALQWYSSKIKTIL